MEEVLRAAIRLRRPAVHPPAFAHLDTASDGTVAPWVVVSSLPFAPKIVLPAIDYFVHDVGLKTGNRYGFKATFNPTYPAQSGNRHGCPYVVSGLKRAGFSGGWL